MKKSALELVYTGKEIAGKEEEEDEEYDDTKIVKSRIRAKSRVEN